ncbi:MAG TPA: beta-mannanase [Planctomycetes bacterium]|nr:beta-mannanase [Planctomycetota bacterium]
MLPRFLALGLLAAEVLTLFLSCGHRSANPSPPNPQGPAPGTGQPLPQPNGFPRRLILVPPASGLYHAAFPDFGGYEDQVSAQRIWDFESLAGKPITWAYFSNNWFTGIQFPALEVAEIAAVAGRVPFIRIMPRNDQDILPDPTYTLDAFLAGTFDADIRRWAEDARDTNIPLLVEFGTEANGDWFPWNATWNGGAQKTGYGDPNEYDGQERFRDTYRRIVRIFREVGANNVTWFFHVDCYSCPDTPWNSAAGYYPGDAYVDWIGISCYGPQEPGEPWQLLTDALDDTYAGLAAISTTKPMALLEYAVVDDPATGPKNAWISDAMSALATGRYPRIRAASWWHENFDMSNLRIDSSLSALAAYQSGAARPQFVTQPQWSWVSLRK